MVSAVTRVEVVAALWRKVTMRQLSAAHAAVLVREFEADWYGHGRPPLFSAVAASAPVLRAAANLVPIHRLRAYDAVVLASALTVRRLEPEVGFLAWDTDLSAAAAREGFAQRNI